jgi:FdhD protein
MTRVTRRHLVRRVAATGATVRSDRLAVEEPLEIRIGGEAFAVTMRTPGDDIDLIHGYCFAEQIITAAEDIVTARYCAGTGPDGLNTYNVLDLTLAPGVVPPAAAARKVVTSSACGVCGTTSIETLMSRIGAPVPEGPSWPAELIAAAPDRLRERQAIFDRTGGVHAAGLLTGDGELLCVREDVGRHNAVDKVIGWALREGRLPLREAMLVVSGRASYELVQKASLAAIPVLVAVSAPSSLAVELAEQSGVTVIGFVRDGSMNIYTHPERVLADPA